jgi:hypothetical protein
MDKDEKRIPVFCRTLGGFPCFVFSAHGLASLSRGID